MSREWWRYIEIRDPRCSRLKCQTPRSLQGEVKEQHRPLQLVEVSQRWAPCCSASLEFHELRGIVVPRLSEKNVRDCYCCFFKSPSNISFINAFNRMPHQFSFLTHEWATATEQHTFSKVSLKMFSLKMCMLLAYETSMKSIFKCLYQLYCICHCHSGLQRFNSLEITMPEGKAFK